jgi:flagellar biosynthesis/type III secretory pathway M-ring protein FliF/YscJ
MCTSPLGVNPFSVANGGFCFTQSYSLIYSYILLVLLLVSVSLLVELSCSIRRRALDLLYGMCDVSNAKDIVEELLQVSL